jgi:N6-L-threonylcarbamoyladenine synthase
MIILGIETSCDETSAAIVRDGIVVSNVVLSQEVHRGFGGVVPEVASRGHTRMLVPIVAQTLCQAGLGLDDVDCIAVTLGPGLIGSLIVGVAFAKGLCLSLSKPLIGVDHVESHIAANHIAGGVPDGAFVCLVVSGGHSHIFRVGPDLEMSLLGCTRDDAAGEAFDKVARMLGLPYPGGPEIEDQARNGDPHAIDFPRAALPEPYGFSFSGVKTAVRYFIDRHHGEISPSLRADIAASFQEAVVDVLVEKCVRAALDSKVTHLSAVGGVAANSRLRARLKQAAECRGLTAILPPPELCTDNGAIVAMTGYLRHARGETSHLSVSPYSTRTY